MRYTVGVSRYETSWFKEGTEILHRLDGPAVEWADGSKEWWVEGKLHRLDGPAVEWADGDKEWWVEGKLHRLDGPAVEWINGTKKWWVEGKLHRLDGPAVEWADGDKEWWVEGKRLTEEKFLKFTKPAKKMTIKEIQDTLGYKIEVVE